MRALQNVCREHWPSIHGPHTYRAKAAKKQAREEEVPCVSSTPAPASAAIFFQPTNPDMRRSGAVKCIQYCLLRVISLEKE
jgi:hypothetical protein